METLNWVYENWEWLAGTAGTVCLGASIALSAVAKHTANKTDDEIARWLSLVVYALRKLSVNVDLPDALKK